MTCFIAVRLEIFVGIFFHGWKIIHFCSINFCENSFSQFFVDLYSDEWEHIISISYCKIPEKTFLCSSELLLFVFVLENALYTNFSRYLFSEIYREVNQICKNPRKLVTAKFSAPKVLRLTWTSWYGPTHFIWLIIAVRGRGSAGKTGIEDIMTRFFFHYHHIFPYTYVKWNRPCIYLIFCFTANL